MSWLHIQAVAVQGSHPGYQLQNADLTCSTLSELNVYNIRRLFANRGQEFMDRNKQIISSRGNGVSFRRRVAGGVCDP